MAVDMFLRIDGVKGEAQDKEHEGEIDVLAWSWGVSNSGTMHMGRGGGAVKANVQDISFTKYVDAASSPLLEASIVGTHFSKVTFVVRKAGDNPPKHVQIDMNDVIVTSISTGGSGGEDRPTENVTLNFGRFKQTYTAQNPDGSEGPKFEFGYDIAAGKLENEK